MVSNRKRRQQNRRLLNQLNETADDFIIGSTGISIEKTSEADRGDDNAESHKVSYLATEGNSEGTH